MYSSVVAISDFIQQEPDEGQPATEKTEAWILFDEVNLYISARNWDSHPEREIANELRRDNGNILGNENFTFVIDTFHDRRNGYLFQTNPLGALPRRDDSLVLPLARTALLTILPADCGGALRPPSCDPVAPPLPASGAAEVAIQGALLDAKVMDALRAMDVDCPGLLERLVDAYAKSAPVLMAELRRAAACDDLPAVRQAAHTLKSSHANLGALGVSALFADIEAAAKNGARHALNERLGLLEAQFESALRALKALKYSRENSDETRATVA